MFNMKIVNGLNNGSFRKQKNRYSKFKAEQGYSLLEYAAGAAIIMGILYFSLNAMGTGVKDLMQSVGTWASQQKVNLTSNTPSAN
jgi:hypothetical protein